MEYTNPTGIRDSRGRYISKHAKELVKEAKQFDCYDFDQETLDEEDRMNRIYRGEVVEKNIFGELVKLNYDDEYPEEDDNELLDENFGKFIMTSNYSECKPLESKFKMNLSTKAIEKMSQEEIDDMKISELDHYQIKFEFKYTTYYNKLERAKKRGDLNRIRYCKKKLQRYQKLLTKFA